MAEFEKHPTGLLALSWKKAAGFGLLIFGRLLPSLIAFAKDTGFDMSCYVKGKEAVWAALRNGQDTTMYYFLMAECSRNVPDPDDFSHESKSDALNAALVMTELLEFIVDHKIEHITYAASLALDSVGLYVNSRGPFPADAHEQLERINAHALTREEVGRQEEDVSFLTDLRDDFDDQTIALLKKRVASQPSLVPLTS